MKKLIFLIFASLVLISASAKFSFAAPYWEQSFSQSSSEYWDPVTGTSTPIGQFDGIGVLWDNVGSKFTINPTPLSGFSAGTWTLDNGNDGTGMLARSNSLMNNVDFFINFQPDGNNPLVTSFYYGIFRGNTPIQGQHFSFDGQAWSSYFIDRETFNRVAGGVVPEPISSTLFLLGGAALGMKKLRNRRKK